MVIEDATEEDLPQILAIYNEAIATSTAVFSDRPVTLGEQQRWLRARRARDYPVLVARAGSAVAGFATYGEFRPAPGYLHTVEDSLYVVGERRRQGIGRGLLEELLARARGAGLHAIVAAIDADNDPSLLLHEQLGFYEVGRMPQVARKFGRWLDLVLLQRALA